LSPVELCRFCLIRIPPAFTASIKSQFMGENI
jgi:hypothetical protein